MSQRRFRRPGGPPLNTAAVSPAGMLTITAPAAQAGRSVAVQPTGTVLGRDAGSDLALSDEHVSRRHALVRLRDGEHVVEDLGSRNGTLINGEPVVGVVAIHDGDRLQLGDAEIEFGLVALRRTPPERSTPAGDKTWWSTAPTRPEPVVPKPGGRDRPESLGQQLHEAPGFSVRALVLAVAGSLVGAALTTGLGTGPWGSLAGAAFAPIISTTFATKRTGEKGRVRTVAIVLLSAAALFITWGGVSVAEQVAGRSVLPGSGTRHHTFPVDTEGGGPEDDGGKMSVTPLALPRWGVEATGSVDCGSASIGDETACTPDVTMKNTGTQRVRITRLEVTGEHVGDFSAEGCVDTWLDTGETCGMAVRFRPTSGGTREATLVVHQNLPLPDRGTNVRLTGNGVANDGPCISGYVLRDAVPGDEVCVLPETRDQAQEDNSLADSRRNPDGGPYGPDTCLDGYVWRGAIPSDHVCVSGATRERTAQDNAMADSHRAG